MKLAFVYSENILLTKNRKNLPQNIIQSVPANALQFPGIPFYKLKSTSPWRETDLRWSLRNGMIDRMRVGSSCGSCSGAR
jgi:hypothetical protein